MLVASRSGAVVDEEGEEGWWCRLAALCLVVVAVP
jgi:hypothetical protein